jgi:rod shape-determining protein MreD
MNVKPDLMLIYVVCTAFINGEYEGSFYGAICGLMQDCIFCDFIGVNLFLYTICGFIAGLVYRMFYKENYLAPVLCVVCLSFLYNFIYYVLYVLLRGDTNLLYFIKVVFIPATIYNCVFTLPVYAVSYYINEYMSINNIGKRRLF